MATAKGLLKQYGYTNNDGAWTPARPSSEIWVETEGGWFCYQRATASIATDASGAGLPWGKVVDGMPGYVQVPFTQKPNFAFISGVHPGLEDHEQFFEWVWPEERLVEIYAHSAALTPEGKTWVKVDNEYKLVEA